MVNTHEVIKPWSEYLKTVIPPDTLHITLPNKDLVLAVVNTPPFNIDNYVVVDESTPLVTEALSKLKS